MCDYEHVGCAHDTADCGFALAVLVQQSMALILYDMPFWQARAVYNACQNLLEPDRAINPATHTASFSDEEKLLRPLNLPADMVVQVESGAARDKREGEALAGPASDRCPLSMESGECERDAGKEGILDERCIAALIACRGDAHVRFEEWDAVVDAGEFTHSVLSELLSIPKCLCALLAVVSPSNWFASHDFTCGSNWFAVHDFTCGCVHF